MRSLVIIGFLITLLTAVTGRGDDHHARSVLAAYVTAVEKNDSPAFVRLADPNMRSYMERAWLRKEDTIGFIDAITAHPVRVVRSASATVYIGWVRVEHPDARHSGWNLMPLLVGEGRTIGKCSKAVESLRVNDTPEWQVFAPAGLTYWCLANAHNPSEQATSEAALAKIDDALLASWYFEGSINARRDIQRYLPLP